MTVFKRSITAFVILTAGFIGNSAYGLWGYPVEAPVNPTLNNTKVLTNPTVEDIQAAIAPNTRIVVVGSVDASSGSVLHVDADDVRITFHRADVVRWSGYDTWDGFINISGHRVQIANLRFQGDAGPGRCRGVVLDTPASDVRIVNCEFNSTADGMVADGNWERVFVLNSSFLNCGNWSDQSMPGGYGMFLQDRDGDTDNLRLKNVTITLGPTSAQHGLRISQVQNTIIDNCDIGANQKRSFWAYGVDQLAIRSTTFHTGSVLFNLMTSEFYTTRPVTNVRLDSCRIEHTTILQPIDVYCGRGTSNILMRDIDIYSANSPDRWLGIGWRGDVTSSNIRWYDGSITFNGNVMHGWDGTSINDWTKGEAAAANIGPVDDPRN